MPTRNQRSFEEQGDTFLLVLGSTKTNVARQSCVPDTARDVRVITDPRVPLNPNSPDIQMVSRKGLEAFLTSAVHLCGVARNEDRFLGSVILVPSELDFVVAVPTGVETTL